MMSRRAVVLVLAAVIAVAVAIPALADSGTTAESASVKGLSVRALGKAKAALRTARAAKRSAHRVASQVGDAQDSATAAKSSAAAASAAATAAQAASGAAGNSAASALKEAASASEKAGGAELNSKETRAEVAATRSRVGFAEGAVSTESPSFEKLGGGPAVTITVPPSGLVQVWGQALVDSAAGGADAAVSLYEDGQQVEGQAECGEAEGVLFAGAAVAGEPELVGTPAVPNLTGTCGSLGAPAPVLFRSTTGEHSFELRYASCACTGSAEKVTFSERRLVVAPLP